MIGSGLKKIAQEHSMQVGNGVAYGSLGGFNATMSDGPDLKRIIFTTQIPDPVKKTELQTMLNGHNLRKEFRVTELTFAPKAIRVVFYDTIGTMKKIRAFLDFFLPLLRDAGATGANVCAECGCEMTGGCWKMIDGIAYRMHDACAAKVQREIAESETTAKENLQGSYMTGLVGALLGSAVGAVLWAAVLYAGYVASIVGFAIGWLAERGYALLKGKQGKGKIAILIIAVIFGVLVGNFGADAITLVTMINDGLLPGMSYGDIPAMILIVLLEDSAYAGATVKNILLGLAFAALGVWSLLRRANAEVSDTKIVDLK